MISFSGITNSLSANQTDLIAVVHLYKNSTEFLRLATESVLIDTYMYRGVVDSNIQWNEKWNYETDNSVTQSTPSLTLKNEKWPDGSGSLIETLYAASYTGGRADILIGYKGHALSTFATIWSGKSDDFSLSNGAITGTLKKKELASSHIGGRRINDQLIGTDDYTANIAIPKESNERYLPVPFGNHWNAPLVLYRSFGVDTLDQHTYWCYVDQKWDVTNMNVSASTGVRPLKIKQDNLWQATDGDEANRYVIFIENEGRLVPRYQHSMNGNTVFTCLDSSSYYTPALFVDSPSESSDTILFDQQIVCNVPLRLYRITASTPDWNNISLTAGGAAADGTASDIDKLLNDNSADALGPYYNATNGTYAELIFNAIVDMPKQLRSDLRFAVYSDLPIDVPQLADGGESYETVVFGKFAFDPAGAVTTFRSHNYLFAFTVGNDRVTYSNLLPTPATSSATWLADWAAPPGYTNFIGCTFLGIGAGLWWYDYYPPNALTYENDGQDFGYNYMTHTRLNNAGVAIVPADPGHNLFSSDDRVELNNLADCGNINNTSPEYSAYNLLTEAMGERAKITRKALNEGVGFRVELRWDAYNDAATDEVAATFTALWLEVINTIDFDWTTDKYTHLKGYHDTNYTDLDSMDAQFADEQYQYLELIIRRKIAAAAGDMGAEWQYIADAWNDMFGAHRTGSGFVTSTKDEMPFDEFLKDYLSHEPYTCYIDQLGKYRLAMFPVDRTSLLARAMFADKIDTIAFNDCDEGFDLGFTGRKNLCSQIKECKTNHVYFDESYVENHEWQVPSGGYSYSFWDSDNTATNNKHKLDKLEKKYTSKTEPSIVVDAADSTKGYNCKVTNLGTSIPLVRGSDPDVKYWEPMAGTSADWGIPATYTASGQAGDWIGWDSENKKVAGYWLNQWCNRHRTVTCSSSKPVFLKYEIGDFVRFSGVPYTCLGLAIYGFNDSVATSATVNGQTVYDYFIITRVSKSLGRTEIECVQLHKLDQFVSTRLNRKVYDGRRRPVFQ